MPPIKRMQPEDELITHIKNSLIGHEEEYLPGAWERFEKKEDKNKSLVVWFSRLAGVAAIVLIGLFWFLKDTPVDVSQTFTKTNTKITPSEDPGSSKSLKEKSFNSYATKKENKEAISQSKTGPDYINPIIENLSDKPQMAKVDDIPFNNTKTQFIAPIQSPVNAADNSKLAIVNKTNQSEKKMSFEDFLKKETGINKINSKSEPTPKRSNKWDLGLVVAPSFGNSKKINMGYGLSMGYNLSDRISLNSGISYNDMAASSSPVSTGGPVMSSPTTSAIVRSGSKNLESIDAKVSGLDIPLELKYNLSKKIYANVGISAFTVLNQSRNNNFLQERIEQQPSSNADSFAETRIVVSNERITEEVPESEIKSSKYIGFYNFSFGFKQKISKKNTFSVEPFMKVPMKKNTADNLRLLGTGVKLKFDF
jgi:cytoskeletal protein RodZ